jgi:enterochelin esterase-like enzyme
VTIAAALIAAIYPRPVLQDVSRAAVEIVLRVDDPAGQLRAVRLVTELSKRLPPRPFLRRPGALFWELRFPRPNVERLEYLLELEHRDGRIELVCDPANPLRAQGAFGDRSVLELPGYEPPAWLADDEAPAGEVAPLRLRSRLLRAVVSGLLWSSPGARHGAPLPLLVVHDGPEYADYSLLLRFLEVAAAEKEVPPLRAALLAPVERDQHYSASALYSAALVRELLPRLAERAPSAQPPVGMGASLGALALLHAHRTHPHAFSGLFLQSGSFFRQRFDSQESGFVRFGRITRFLGRVVQTDGWPDPVPVTITCGTAEENLANNRATAAALAGQGYPVRFHEQPDAHNWVAWRDSFDPHLPELLQRAWT